MNISYLRLKLRFVCFGKSRNDHIFFGLTWLPATPAAPE
jgi:hypothetical protein